MEQLQLEFSFTKLCIRCGIEKEKSAFGKSPIHKNKDGIRQPCKECRKIERDDPEEKKRQQERNRNYIKNNKDKKAISDAIYYKNNKPKIQAYFKSYYELNKDKIQAQAREYVRNNGDANKIKCAQWYKDNTDRVKQYYTRTYPLKRDQFNAYSRKRRALRNNAEGKHTAEDIQALFIKQSGKCNGCDNELQTTGKFKYHVDHIIPLSRGGSNWPNNLQLLCPYCNLSKADKTQEEWELHKEKFNMICN